LQEVVEDAKADEAPDEVGDDAEEGGDGNAEEATEEGDEELDGPDEPVDVDGAPPRGLWLGGSERIVDILFRRRTLPPSQSRGSLAPSDRPTRGRPLPSIP
jgi:hypothetical protein